MDRRFERHRHRNGQDDDDDRGARLDKGKKPDRPRSWSQYRDRERRDRRSEQNLWRHEGKRPDRLASRSRSRDRGRSDWRPEQIPRRSDGRRWPSPLRGYGRRLERGTSPARKEFCQGRGRRYTRQQDAGFDPEQSSRMHDEERTASDRRNSERTRGDTSYGEERVPRTESKKELALLRDNKRSQREPVWRQSGRRHVSLASGEPPQRAVVAGPSGFNQHLHRYDGYDEHARLASTVAGVIGLFPELFRAGGDDGSESDDEVSSADMDCVRRIISGRPPEADAFQGLYRRIARPNLPYEPVLLTGNGDPRDALAWMSAVSDSFRRYNAPDRFVLTMQVDVYFDIEVDVDGYVEFEVAVRVDLDVHDRLEVYEQ